MTRGSFARKRPRKFDGTSSAEVAVLDSTERLLSGTALQDLTVAQILQEAGLSRANFYHYFANKYDVLVALLGRAFEESYGQVAPWAIDPGRDRAKRMGSSLEQTLDMWDKHGDVICAVIEHMHTEPAVGAAWQRMYAQFVAATSEQITFERAERRAPEGAPADMIAAMLVGAAERVFYVSARGLDPRLAGIDDVDESLRAITEAGIFGGRTIRAVEPTKTGPAERFVVSNSSGFSAQGDTDSGTGGAILQGMRELLVDSTLDEISVAKILERAGTSRASFYFYFRSKEDAFVALFRQSAADVVDGLSGIADADRTDLVALTEQVGKWLDLQGFAGPIIRNAVHVWPRLPELRTEYLAAMNAMETVLESIIERDRAAGIAPDGPPVPQYAATILWSVERVVAGALAGEAHLEDLDQVREMVGAFIYAAIYGRRS